jgi:hypothetical protein
MLSTLNSQLFCKLSLTRVFQPNSVSKNPTRTNTHRDVFRITGQVKYFSNSC